MVFLGPEVKESLSKIHQSRQDEATFI